MNKCLNLRNKLLVIFACFIVETGLSLVADKTFYEVQGAEYNGIKCLLERVKNGDRNSIRLLAESYRYGNGVEKCLLNAFYCYNLCGENMDRIAKDSYLENPNDELGLLFHLMDTYDKRGIEEAQNELSSIILPNEKWATVLKNICEYGNKPDLNEFIRSQINAQSAGDEFFVAMACYVAYNKSDVDLSLFQDILSDLAVKVPFLYNNLGEKYLMSYEEDVNNKNELKLAIEYFKAANDNGFLIPKNAKRILSEEVIKNIDIKDIFSLDDLEQLKILRDSVLVEADEDSSMEVLD